MSSLLNAHAATSFLLVRLPAAGTQSDCWVTLRQGCVVAETYGWLVSAISTTFARSLTTHLSGCMFATPMWPEKSAVVCEEECEVAAETSVSIGLQLQRLSCACSLDRLLPSQRCEL